MKQETKRIIWVGAIDYYRTLIEQAEQELVNELDCKYWEKKGLEVPFIYQNRECYTEE